MLVMTFKVQISRPGRLSGMAVLEHVVMRGAGVKPDIKNVSTFNVIGRAMLAVCTDDGFSAGFAPGLNTFRLDHTGRQVHDLHGAGVQLAGSGVNKEGQGHAPIALAADAPVGPTRNHALQTNFAVFRIKTGFFDTGQCQLAQCFAGFVFGENALRAGACFIHANKPLCGSAVDHGRFMTPAMRVAVSNIFSCEQAPVFTKCLNHQRSGFPDVEAAKHRQVINITAIALHRIQNVVCCYAVGHAGVKVFYAISWRRMNDTRAVICCCIVRQIHRAQTLVASIYVVKRVLEIKQGQVFSLGSRQNRAA